MPPIGEVFSQMTDARLLRQLAHAFFGRGQHPVCGLDIVRSEIIPYLAQVTGGKPR